MRRKWKRHLGRQIYFLRLMGFTRKMIAYRLNWVEGYKQYHRCSYLVAFNESLNRIDTLFEYQTLKALDWKFGGYLYFQKNNRIYTKHHPRDVFNIEVNK